MFSKWQDSKISLETLEKINNFFLTEPFQLYYEIKKKKKILFNKFGSNICARDLA